MSNRPDWLIEEQLKARVRQTWQLVCEAHGCPPTEKFVVFDESKPETSWYNGAVQNLQAWQNERRR